MNKITKIIKEGERKFDKGYYTFQFWFFDKENIKRYETCYVNDLIPFEEAYKMAKQHISDFGKSGMCYFFENEERKFHIASQNKKLLEAVIKEIENKRKIIGGGINCNTCGKDIVNNLCNCEGYNQALSDIKEFLTETLKEL